MIKVLIVDDELHGRENLKVLLSDNFSFIDIVGTANDAFQAKMLIEELKPDLVFLDINMGKVNGLDLLSTFNSEGKLFETIFVTAYDKFAIEALKVGAAGYILKPIITDELISEVNRVCDFIKSKKPELFHPVELEHGVYAETILINHSNGYFFVNANNIIRAEALNNYCKIYLIDAMPVTTSKTLKAFSEQLNPEIFYRIHKTHLVNLNYIKEYKSSGNGMAVLRDGSEIKVAVLKRAEFKKRLKSFMNSNV